MPTGPAFPVHDDYGREIGGVSREGTGWRATALDGARLGGYADRGDAESAVRLDWSLGRPRDPHTHERYRPVRGGLGAGVAPLYLGR
jgi:hypothetical protein